MALTHTGFMLRLFLLRRGGAWNNQKRESHAVPWPLAWEKLWPHTLAGFALIGLVAATRPGEIGYAFMAAGGLALSAPFAVVTAAPRVGTWLSRFGHRAHPGGNGAVGRAAVAAPSRTGDPGLRSPRATLKPVRKQATMRAQ